MNESSTSKKLSILFRKKKIVKRELTSLLQVVETLKEQEYKYCSTFLDSEFYNRDQGITILFNRIRIARNKASTSIRAKDLIKKMYGPIPEEVVEKKLTEAVKKLENLILKFIGVQELKDNPLLEQRLLTIGLKKRKNTGLFFQAANKYEKLLSQEPLTIMRLEAEWWLEHQRHFHQNTEQANSGIKWFKSADQKFDQFVHLAKLRYICEAYNRRNVLNEEFNVSIPQTFLNNKPDENDTLDVIWLYREILPLIKEPFKVGAVRRFAHHFFNKAKYLAAPDQLVLAKLLHNVLMWGINRSYPQVFSEEILLLKYMVRNDLLLFERVISDDEYLNIAIISGVGGAFKFQSYFIKHYALHLEDRLRDKAQYFAKIYQKFQFGEYRVVIKNLKILFPSKTQDENKYSLRAKALLLRAQMACYLQGNYDCYEGYTKASDNLRHYIKREERINNRYYEAYRNLISICDSMVSRYNQKQKGPKTVQLMEDKLAKLNPIIAQTWILKQIQMLN